MFIRSFALGFCLLLAIPASADPVEDLIEALGVSQLVEIMRSEGIEYGEDLARDMRPGGPDASWRATVDQIYAIDRMQVKVRSGMAERLQDVDVTPLLEFFTSDAGAELVALEISARRAMLDDTVEQAARDSYRDVAGTSDPRLTLLERFVEVNDLIEANVAGSLNASFQFYNGLADGGALDTSQADILRDVWAQEAETREDTEIWVFGFLMLAYGPVEDTILTNYVALSETPEGRTLNRALFAGFNAMYDQISYDLGRAIARDMQAQDL